MRIGTPTLNFGLESQPESGTWIRQRRLRILTLTLPSQVESATSKIDEVKSSLTAKVDDLKSKASN